MQRFNISAQAPMPPQQSPNMLQSLAGGIPSLAQQKGIAGGGLQGILTGRGREEGGLIGQGFGQLFGQGASNTVPLPDLFGGGTFTPAEGFQGNAIGQLFGGSSGIPAGGFAGASQLAQTGLPAGGFANATGIANPFIQAPLQAGTSFASGAGGLGSIASGIGNFAAAAAPPFLVQQGVTAATGNETLGNLSALLALLLI